MNRKWMAGALATCLVLGSTSVALAAGGRPDGTGKAPTATEVTEKAKGKSADRAQQISALKQELVELRDLQREANDIRHQLNSEYAGLRRAIGQAIEEGKVDVLKELLPQLKELRESLRVANVEQDREQVETQGFASAKKGGDVSLGLARITAAQERVQARIDALKAALEQMTALRAEIEAQVPADGTEVTTEDGEEPADDEAVETDTSADDETAATTPADDSAADTTTDTTTQTPADGTATN